MKSKEIEVLTSIGREVSNKMLNAVPGSEEYKIAKSEFNLVLRIMDELAKV